MRVSVWCVSVVALMFVAGVRQANATLIFSEDFEAGTVASDLSTLAGWVALGDSGFQEIGSDGSNKFVTTGNGNNSASRYRHAIANPGLGPGQKLIMTMDVYDPLVNSQSSVNTYPRAYGGVFQLSSGEFIPPYFGINIDDSGPSPVDTSEWVVSGEGFVSEQFTGYDSIAQDTWYTVRSEFNLGAKTMDVYAKTRDGIDPFVALFTNAAAPFVNASQDLTLLDTWMHRMNRGTRIDNIRVEAIPEPSSCAVLLIAAACLAAIRKGRCKIVVS